MPMSDPQLLQARRKVRDSAGVPTGELGEPEWFIVVGGFAYPVATALSVPPLPVDWVEVQS